ncbi:hypothetical protein G7Y89_g6513 [Cudoniella acicularis]|uniref:4-nitrophenylphosphatase n=1 Tax=Cudoniella acicularis TaxID=354080 RepID=A0A8H4RMM2_9HELO|nr:hypothetical protein G7Y89_g6513 [Cudoniella acicularis]
MASNPQRLTGDKPAIDAFIDKFDIFLFDCDGVLWSGDHLFPGTVETLELLRSKGKKIVFVTNNSTKSRADYQKKLTSLGIPSNVDEIFASAYSSAIYIARIMKLPAPKNKVYVIGEAGIETELRSEGVEFIGGTDPAYRRDITPEDYKNMADGSMLDENVGIVLAGLDFHINYLKLALGYQYLARGAKFLATNTDSTLPSNHSFFPGAGSISIPLVNMTGQKPIALGKPSQAMMDSIEGKFQFDRKTACMVGDRLDTDIKFGLEGKLGGTLAVLTGVMKKEQWEEQGAEVVPHYYVEKLNKISAGIEDDQTRRDGYTQNAIVKFKPPQDPETLLFVPAQKDDNAGNDKNPGWTGAFPPTMAGAMVRAVKAPSNFQLATKTCPNRRHDGQQQQRRGRQPTTPPCETGVYYGGAAPTALRPDRVPRARSRALRVGVSGPGCWGCLSRAATLRRVHQRGFEYHEQAVDALRARCVVADDGAWKLPAVLYLRNLEGSHADLYGGVESLSIEGQEDNQDADIEDEEERKTVRVAHLASKRCYRSLSISLLLCGCLKSAYDFCTRGLAITPGDEELLQAKEYIQNIAKRRLKVDEVDINDLPDQGLVRREIYPWNDHEPDRYAQETLDFLNKELEIAAPKVEVKVVELPNLVEALRNTEGYGVITTNKQLGLFAKEDIEPGEVLLDELSLLAANNLLKESLCDACSTVLPPLTEDSKVVSCPDCDDIMFCNNDCLSRAQESYHPAICDTDIDTIAKDPDPKEKPFALYLLLLGRVFAMSATQEIHPLELKEVKYIWGDFLPCASNAVPLSPNSGPPPIWTLPFSFSSNISGPFHILEKMDIDIFSSLPQYDLWIFNTLYAKFRGTASGRLNETTGHPEVAAVHPLWCLANHDCDPNERRN